MALELVDHELELAAKLLLLCRVGLPLRHRRHVLDDEESELVGGAVMLLGAFFALEARVESPLVPPALLRLRNLACANVVGLLWASAMFAWFFLSAQYLQLVLGYKPLKVGLAFLPGNLVMGALSVGLSAKIVMRFGIKRPLGLGLLLATARTADFLLALAFRLILDHVQQRAARVERPRHGERGRECRTRCHLHGESREGQ